MIHHCARLSASLSLSSFPSINCVSAQNSFFLFFSSLFYLQRWSLLTVEKGKASRRTRPKLSTYQHQRRRNSTMNYQNRKYCSARIHVLHFCRRSRCCLRGVHRCEPPYTDSLGASSWCASALSGASENVHLHKTAFVYMTQVIRWPIAEIAKFFATRRRRGA